MTELDLELPGLASELIAEFGKLIIYTRTTAGTYNPATSQNDIAGISKSIKAIVEPWRGQRMLAGLVEIGDLKVTVAAEDFADGPPTPEDITGIDAGNYNVITVLPTYSGDSIAIYELQVRGS